MSSPPPYSPIRSTHEPRSPGRHSEPRHQRDGYGSVPISHIAHERSALIAQKKSTGQTSLVIVLLAVLFCSIVSASVLVPTHWTADARLEGQHRREIVQLKKGYEEKLQQKDSLNAKEIARLTLEFELQLQQKDDQNTREIARLTRDFEERLQRKDDWVARERTRLDAREWAVQRERQRLEDWVAREKHALSSREDAVRREEERIKLDAERRSRTNIYWGSLEWDPACVAWKKMHYSAELLNLPRDVDGVAWCKQTSIDIFGTTYERPEYCTKTMEGRVIGHWTRTDEPHCNTYWGNLQDWGCQEGLPGHRRVRMQLLDHHKPWDETWFPLCETTPWPGHGTPQNCEQAPNGQGIWGEWRLQDDMC